LHHDSWQLAIMFFFSQERSLWMIECIILLCCTYENA
jgi:hypothetical protein